MEVEDSELKSFLEKCDSFGGHCDCEILFNAEEKIMDDMEDSHLLKEEHAEDTTV
jgi:hypothetical protein